MSRCGSTVTVHLWDGANIVADIDGSNVRVYIRGINLIYANDGDKTYYHFNAHGDVVALTNVNGNKTKSYSYSAFGIEYTPSDFDDNPFRYCGEYYDKETKTIYLRARYYDANQGRFTQEDPIRDGYNWYSYCGGNPVMFIDPTGKSMEDFIVGLALTLDAGIFGGLIITILEAFADIDPDYVPDDEVDYYLGRVIGDILSMVSGIKSLIAGLQMILASIAAGGFTTVSSGGTLSVAGVTICVEGVAADAVVVEYGVLSTAAAVSNLGSDFDNLVKACKANSNACLPNDNQYSPSLPTDKTRLNHIFRNKKGHILDTPDNRALLSDAAIADNYIGTDSYGNVWHAKILDDGRQVWIESRNGVIWDGGVNDIPQSWDPIVGLKNKH